ncbi:MAG: RNA degradosome polyphosphate kinase, partial [Gammaproteobacteria bacterium]
MPRPTSRSSRTASTAATQDLDDPSLYLNRELSQLAFNFRVLAQAMDESVPLLERLRYLCISCTNLDEFFEIRVAGLHQMQEMGAPLPPDGIASGALLNLIHTRASALVEAQYQYWRQTLRPALSEAGVRILSPESWNARQRRWL